MIYKNLFVEDLILHLSGFSPIDLDLDPPKLVSSDYSLIHSFAKQITRGIGFTDRQFELAKTKVDDYSSVFDFVSNLNDIKEKTRIPLRQIDRSRWIKIVNDDSSNARIAIRFTFQKKLISCIEDLRKRIEEKGDYDKENKIHYFDYNEKNLYNVIKSFEGKNFEISSEAQSIYDFLCQLKEEDHIPGVYNYEIKNMPQVAIDMLHEEIGKPSPSTLLLYKDRSFRYGLNNVDLKETDNTSVASKIANRTHINVYIDEKKYKLDSILLGLEELKRFPILVMLSQSTCYDTLVEFTQFTRNIIPNNQISVMFRLDNKNDGLEFNNYIKKENLNNKLDKDTKIVYTLDNKVPKPLISSSWDPKTIIINGTNTIAGTKKFLDCYNDKDLILYYGGDHSQLGMSYYYRRSFDIL